MRRKPGDLWTYEYQHDGKAEALVFEVPSFLTTAKVRAAMMAADTAFFSTELAKRWVSGEALNAETVPAADWEKHMAAQVVALVDVLALCRSHTIEGEAQDVGLLANDETRHDHLRYARAVLFRLGGNEDAISRNGTSKAGGAPEVGASDRAAGEGPTEPHA